MDIDLSKTQKYLDWLKKKLYLDKIAYTSKNRFVKRGQVYWCEFGIGIGSEMSKETARPCVVIQKTAINKNSPNTIVVSITHDTSSLPCLVPIREYFDNCGNKILDGKVNVSNIVCVSKSRLTKQICQLDSIEVDEISKKIMYQLDIYKSFYDASKQLSKIRQKLQIGENDDVFIKLQELLDNSKKL